MLWKLSTFGTLSSDCIAEWRQTKHCGPCGRGMTVKSVWTGYEMK